MNQYLRPRVLFAESLKGETIEESYRRVSLIREHFRSQNVKDVFLKDKRSLILTTFSADYLEGDNLRELIPAFSKSYGPMQYERFEMEVNQALRNAESALDDCSLLGFLEAPLSFFAHLLYFEEIVRDSF